MLKSLLAALALTLSTAPALAATLTITAQGTVDTARPGIGAAAGDSFSMTATVSEPAFFSDTSGGFTITQYQIETLNAQFGPSTLSLIGPTTSAFLQIQYAGLADISSVNLFMNPGTFTSPANTFFGNFGTIWVFNGELGDTFADLATLDFTTAFQASFGSADSRTASNGVDGTITAQSFTLPAPNPLPAAGWLLLAGLGGLGLARRRAHLSRVGPASAPT